LSATIVPDVARVSAANTTYSRTLSGVPAAAAAAAAAPATHAGSEPDTSSSSASTPTKSSVASSSIGASHVSIIRNYVGDDDMAGDFLIISIDMVGKVRIWILPEEGSGETTAVAVNDGGVDGTTNDKPLTMYPAKEFVIQNATGTCIWPLPPIEVGDVLVAVPCLDGSVVLVSTGILTPKTPPKQVAAPPGTILETWSRGTGSIALSGVWHPKKTHVLAIGRQDGIVEILGGGDKTTHRLIQHEAPVRAIAFTPDGQLLITASDDGMISVWDSGRPVVPALVRHVVDAHNGWILSLKALDDSRRFVSSGLDQKLHVWTVGQIDQPVHTFTSDDVSWTIDSYHHQQQQQAAAGGGGGTNKPSNRLVSGNEHGLLHIYSTL